MFKRKLQALGFYGDPSTFNYQDDKEFRNLVIWLEDRIIRFWKATQRDTLRDIGSGNWPDIFTKYLQDLKCPLKSNERKEIVEWLLGQACRFQFQDKLQGCQDESSTQQQQPSHKQSTNLSFPSISDDDPTLKAEIRKLAQFLKMPPYQNKDQHLLMLEGIRKLIEKKLSDESIKDYKLTQEQESEPIYRSLAETPSCGFDIKDPLVEQAVKIITLLHLADLRDLQTKVNAAIVSVQRFTANPKTNESLGKVGR